MRIMKPVMSKISALIRKIKPKKPTTRPRKLAPYGHRGAAYRDLKRPDLSPENQAKWKPFFPEENEGHRAIGEGFIYDAQPFFVHSSNVAMLQYFIEEQKLMVEFLNGSAYMYDNVTEDEAMSFWVMESKGGEVWRLLRVRGSKTAHKKPYHKIK